MIIAELFINIGIKGAEKTVGALKGAYQGMRELGSTSLETKAAIVGAVYALERLFSKSGQAGTDLTNYSALLGTSAQTLQQYQYAARQVGVSNEETESSFKNLASSMAKVRMGEGAPKGFAQVAMMTGGITGADVEKFMKNPELLLQRLQQYAQKEKRVGIRNEVLKSFGLSDNMVAGLTRNAFNQPALKRAPTYSDREIGALDKANIAWSNLGNKVAMAFGHFNASHGGELVKELSQITDKVLILANAFMKFADAIHFFEGLNKAVQGLTMLLDLAAGSINKIQTPKGRESLKEDTQDIFKGMGESYKDSVADSWEKDKEIFGGIFKSFKKGAENLIFGNSEDQPKQTTGTSQPVSSDTKRQSEKPHIGATMNSVFKKEPGVFKPIAEDMFGKNAGKKIPGSAVMSTGGAKPALRLVVPQSPSVSPVKTPMGSHDKTGKTVTQNFNVNQNFSYSNSGKNNAQTADHMKKAVQEAFRQMSSQVQGS